MPAAKTATTTVSTKGQVILPKAIRDAKRWGAGERLVVEETPDGVLLRSEQASGSLKPEDVFGALAHRAKRLSDDEISQALRRAAKSRHAGD